MIRWLLFETRIGDAILALWERVTGTWLLLAGDTAYTDEV